MKIGRKLFYLFVVCIFLYILLIYTAFTVYFSLKPYIVKEQTFPKEEIKVVPEFKTLRINDFSDVTIYIVEEINTKKIMVIFHGEGVKSDFVKLME